VSALGQQVEHLSESTRTRHDVAFVRNVTDRRRRADVAPTRSEQSESAISQLRWQRDMPFPAIMKDVEFATARRLASYGASLADLPCQAASRTAGFSGARAARACSCSQPSRVVINLKDAKALGLAVPHGVSERDEIINETFDSSAFRGRSYEA